MPLTIVPSLSSRHTHNQAGSGNDSVVGTEDGGAKPSRAMGSMVSACVI